jgi:hypothetical protein
MLLLRRAKETSSSFRCDVNIFIALLLASGDAHRAGVEKFTCRNAYPYHKMTENSFPLCRHKIRLPLHALLNLNGTEISNFCSFTHSIRAISLCYWRHWQIVGTFITLNTIFHHWFLYSTYTHTHTYTLSTLVIWMLKRNVQKLDMQINLMPSTYLRRRRKLLKRRACFHFPAQ